ncbi:MAG: NAD(P)-binding protein [Legionellales bacterium]|jgi:renalase|nr:NAD(P)-binding protein [Legionellales bacterium]
MLNIAIIGAGLSGLTLAHNLKDHADITVFEKSRGVGGRIATRYASKYKVDHGAQFFSAKSLKFQKFIKPMIDDGIINTWDANFAEIVGDKIIRKSKWDKSCPHYVGVPGMNAIGKYLSQGLNVLLNTNVTELIYNDKWQVYGENRVDLGRFDWVIVTAPAAQTFSLIPTNVRNNWPLDKIKMQACFSLMLGFDENLGLDFDAALVRDADISWISINSSKPGRDDDYTLLVHSTNSWAESNIDGDKEFVKDFLCAETSRVIGCDVGTANHIGLHGWRYANISSQKEMQEFIDSDIKIAACGDWCSHGRVEASFISAERIAAKVIEDINKLR